MMISAIITLHKSHKVSAVTSCHYYPLTLSASDGECRYIHNNLPKTSGETIYKICILSFCHISRSTGKTQSWCWLALKRHSHIAENDQSHDSSPCWWKLLKEVLTLCWKGCSKGYHAWLAPSTILLHVCQGVDISQSFHFSKLPSLEIGRYTK